jgi:hypothetical protein
MATHASVRGRHLMCICLAASAFLWIGCDTERPNPSDIDQPDARWGPLAVIQEDASVVLDARGGAGPLSITPGCVTLPSGNGTALLVWRDSQTAWDPILSQIVFRDLIRGPIRLSDGDVIEVGGVATSSGGLGGGDSPWLSSPRPGCVGEPFVVHSVTFNRR